MALRDRLDRDDDEPLGDFEEFIQRRRAEEGHRRQQRTYLILIGCLSVACIGLAISNVVLAMRVTGARAQVAAVSSAMPSTSPASALSTPMAPQAPGARGERPAATPTAKAVDPVAPAKAVDPVAPARTADPVAPARAADAVVPARPGGAVAVAEKTAEPADSSPPGRAVETEPPARTAAETDPPATPPARTPEAPATAARAVDRPAAAQRPADRPATTRPVPAASARAAEPRPEPRASRPVDLPPRGAGVVPEPVSGGSSEPAIDEPPARKTAHWMVRTYGRHAAEERAERAARFYEPSASNGAYWQEVLDHIRR